MSSVKKKLIKTIIQLQYRAIKKIRSGMAKIGLLDPLDHFVYREIEDPLFHKWFTGSYKYEVFNDEVILSEREGPCLFASNHQSIMDPLTTGEAIFHNSRRMAYQLTKAELGEDPILGNYVSMNQVIYIKRGASDIEPLKQCVKVMTKDNRPVLIYPEGTYGPGDGVLLPFRTGIARVAWDAQVPVIPIATYGIDKVLPKGNLKKLKKKGLIKITFGERLTISTLFPGLRKGDTPSVDQYQSATQRIQNEVQNLWNAMNEKYKEKLQISIHSHRRKESVK